MIAIDSRTRSKLIWIATMCAPIVVVQGVRMAADGAPTPKTASAAIDTTSLLAAAAPTPITDKQREAIRWLMDRGGGPPTRSPMDRPLPTTPILTDKPDTKPVVAPPPPPDDTPHDLRITSIIGAGSSGQPLATINHRVRRVGEEVAPNWRITRIDSKARVVFLRSSDGRELRLEPPETGNDAGGSDAKPAAGGNTK